MSNLEMKIRNRLESIEDYEAEIRAIEGMILEERDRIVRHLSDYSSPYHVIECVNQAAENIRSLERKLMLCRGYLLRDYERLTEIYMEKEA